MRTLTLALALVIPTTVANADTTAPPPRKFELDGNTLKLPGPVNYETGKATVKTESEPALAHVKAYLDDKQTITMLRIEVHTDAQGADDWNQRLSEQRALAVAQWLVAHGVDCKRLLPVGFGESRPIADNTTAEGRAQNRRTMFVNAALRGRPIGGMPVDGGGKVAGDPCK
jgi:OOP family OmpA-OmpF porin